MAEWVNPMGNLRLQLPLFPGGEEVCYCHLCVNLRIQLYH